jgi:aminoglycoside phosphotransferase family enzyme
VLFVPTLAEADPVSLAAKVAFLSTPLAYGPPADRVERRETHMSWVFLVGDAAFKLKKPVRFPYLDFSTLDRREAACRSELRLNRRLAPGVYEAVVPLARTSHGLAIGGSGEVVEWLVRMRRLDESQTLENAIRERWLAPWQLDRLVATLAAFYRRTPGSVQTPAAHLAEWRERLACNRCLLLHPRLGLPAGLVRRIDRTQRRFLAVRGDALRTRVRGHRIVDGHGDLRPEHIWLGDPVRIIDCLEFNPRLRSVDPLDETAFLCLECQRLGAPWAGEYLRRRLEHALRDGVSRALFTFYRCYRATLRARLAIAHLLEPEPRTPEKWPPLARSYLRLAAADAVELDRLLRRPGDR